MENLKNKFVDSLKWNLISIIVRMILQIVFVVLLTRLLDPDDFGLFAVGMVVVVFGNMLSDFGLGSALVQKKELTEEDIRFVFTVQVALGFFFTIVVYTISPLIASFFDNIKAVDVLAALSSIFLIQSVGLTSASLLKRDLEFQTIQKINIYSYFISYVLIAIPMAYMSYGVWSLVFAQLAQIFVRTVWMIKAKKHSIKPLFNFSERKYFLIFGSKSISNNILSWSIDSIHSIFIGHFLGTIMLGYFNRSLTLVKMPMDMITSTFQSVLFPFYSRIQNRKEVYKSTFLGGSTLMSLLLFPLFFTVALVPETVIYAIFGLKWKISADILTPLALAMPVNTLLALGGPILWGNNKGMLEVRAQFYSVILIAVVLYFLSQISLVVASWGVLITFLIRLYFINRKVLDYVNASWMDFIRVIIKPILLGAAVAFPVKVLDYQLTELLFSPIIILLIDILFAGGVLVFLFFMFMTYLIDSDLYWLIEKNQTKIPRFILKKLGVNDV